MEKYRKEFSLLLMSEMPNTNNAEQQVRNLNQACDKYELMAPFTLSLLDTIFGLLFFLMMTGGYYQRLYYWV